MSAHTRGPLKAERAKKPDNTGGFDYAISDEDNLIVAECFEHVGYAGGGERQYIALPAADNAALISEAFNVATETGMTPRQREDFFQAIKQESQDRREKIEALEAHLAELLASLRCCVDVLIVDATRERDIAIAAIARATGAA